MLKIIQSYIKMRQAEKCLDLILSDTKDNKAISQDLISQILQNDRLLNGFRILEDKQLIVTRRAFGGDIISAHVSPGGKLYYLNKFERNKERFYGFILGLLLGFLMKRFQS